MFLKLLDKLGRKRTIYDREGKIPYLDRYYIFLKDRKNFPFNITLHKVMVSDEPVLHDHPWSYATLILKGGYYENIPLRNDTTGGVVGSTKVWRGPGHFRIRKADDLHWLELKKDKDGKEIPCWSLFYMGTKEKEWGFLPFNQSDSMFERGYKWVHNKEYLEGRNG
jgi:hypothetical protein|tara:strand:+ start:4127 stop:4624 length:498 start_codon:yes stop_codon:yes gene_type:complete